MLRTTNKTGKVKPMSQRVLTADAIAKRWFRRHRKLSLPVRW